MNNLANAMLKANIITEKDIERLNKEELKKEEEKRIQEFEREETRINRYIAHNKLRKAMFESMFESKFKSINKVWRERPRLVKYLIDALINDSFTFAYVTTNNCKCQICSIPFDIYVEIEGEQNYGVVTAMKFGVDKYICVRCRNDLDNWIKEKYLLHKYHRDKEFLNLYNKYIDNQLFLIYAP